MSTEIQIVLNTTKMIKGKEVKPGTVLADVKCRGSFTREDVDLGVQLGQVKIIDVEVKGKEKDKDKDKDKGGKK